MSFKGWEGWEPPQHMVAQDLQFKNDRAGTVSQKRRRSLEEALQKACVEWADRAIFPVHIWKARSRFRPPAKIGDYLYHVPNGGGRSKAEAGIFKAMGVRAGYPDLAFDVPMYYPHEAALVPGWRCELKVDDGKLSQFQETWKERLEAMGFVYCVARHPAEFQYRLELYLAHGFPYIET